MTQISNVIEKHFSYYILDEFQPHFLDFKQKIKKIRISASYCRDLILAQSKIVGRIGQEGRGTPLWVWTIWTAIDSSHVENVLNIPWNSSSYVLLWHSSWYVCTLPIGEEIFADVSRRSKCWKYYFLKYA